MSKPCDPRNKWTGAFDRGQEQVAVFKTPWPGDPRVNIQNAGGQAKAYQVRQVLLAIDKLENGDVI